MWLIKREVSAAFRSDARSLQLDEDKMDVIVCADGRWPRMGIIFGSEALILDYKTMMSFRVQTGNLGFSPKMKILNCKNALDKNFLRKYFAENHDNPYGIQNILQLIYHGRDVTNATQFPPLFLPKLAGKARMDAIERIVGLAKKGDQIFSSHRRSGISAVIRKYDRSQFSHVAPYLGDAQVFDIGPSGGKINSLFDTDEDTHLALYAYKADIADEDREKMVQFVRNKAAKGVRFSFTGIFKVYLRRKFKIPISRKTPTVADLLFSNAFRLVAYV